MASLALGPGSLTIEETLDRQDAASKASESASGKRQKETQEGCNLKGDGFWLELRYKCDLYEYVLV